MAGNGQATRDAGTGRVLRTLTPAECFELLGPGGVGRVGFTSGDSVIMLPVNYAIIGKAIVFRTAPDTLLAVHATDRVSFEADLVNEVRRQGWSVLVQGHAHKVTSEREVEQLEHAARLEPWAGGARDVYVRITPAHISGRALGLPGGPRHVDLVVVAVGIADAAATGPLPHQRVLARASLPAEEPGARALPARKAPARGLGA